MAESEYRGKYEAVKKDPLKPWYPVIGLLLIGIAGAAAFFARQPAYAFLKQNLLQGVGANLPDDTTMEYVVAFGIGLAIIGIFSMVFALFAPKSKNRKLVSESTLKNQKDEMNAERQRAKRRKLQMQSKMKKTRREQNSE
jgi:hypothetical protein